MLDEASIISAMRRPGNDTSCLVSDEYGSASAITKNGRPARKSSSAPWRDDRRPRAAAPVEDGRQRHLRASGLVPRHRAHDEHRAAEADEDHRRDDRVGAMREQQIRRADVAPLGHRLAQERGNLGYRDHARLSTAVPARQAASRFMNQSLFDA